MERKGATKSAIGGAPSATRDGSAIAKDVMTHEVRWANPSTPLSKVVDLMREVDCGLIPIVDHKRELAGVVTDRDIVIRGLSGGSDFTVLKAEDVMTPQVHSVSDDTALEQVMKAMGEWKVRRVPVVDQSQRLVGMISMSDLAMRADCGPELQDALERISVPPGSNKM